MKLQYALLFLISLSPTQTGFAHTLNKTPEGCVLSLIRAAEPGSVKESKTVSSPTQKRLMNEINRLIQSSKEVPSCRSPIDGCTAASLIYAGQIQKHIDRHLKYRGKFQTYMIIALQPLNDTQIRAFDLKISVMAPRQTWSWWARVLQLPLILDCELCWNYHHAVAVIEKDSNPVSEFSEAARVFDPLFGNKDLSVLEWFNKFSKSRRSPAFAIQQDDGTLKLEPGSAVPNGFNFLIALHSPKEIADNIINNSPTSQEAVENCKAKRLEIIQTHWLKEIERVPFHSHR